MRTLLRRHLFPDAADHRVDLGTAEVERRIPHRAPMRLLDGIVAIDAAGGRALGLRDARPDDPVFAGHFPGLPLYPGVLQVELMGQLGLCLAWERLRIERGVDPAAIDARVVGVEDARFLAGVGPDDVIEVAAAVLDEDPLRSRYAGQVRVGDRLCSAALMEVWLA